MRKKQRTTRIRRFTIRKTMRWWWVHPYRDTLMIMVTIKVILEIKMTKNRKLTILQSAHRWMLVMVTLAMEMTKKPDRQTCISPGAIGCECTDAEAAMAATSPAIPVPAAIIWGTECVIELLQIWILKQMFSFFPFYFKLNFSISFSPLPFFRYIQILQKVSFRPCT